MDIFSHIVVVVAAASSYHHADCMHACMHACMRELIMVTFVVRTA